MFKYAIITTSFIILFTVIKINGLPDKIKIGGLFHVMDTEGKIAFESAVDMVNHDFGILPDSVVVADPQIVPEYDSFQVGRTVCALMGEGIAGIFGPQSEETSYHVQSLCDTMEIPHISTRWDPKQRRSSCSINLYPHPSILTRAVADIVSAWKWKEFTIIYDDYNALKKVSSLLKLADNKGCLVTVEQLPNDENYRSVLKKIKHSEEKNIVLECSLDKLYNVLLQAQQVGLMGAEYSFIITSLDFHSIDVEPFKWSGTNITGIRLVDPDSMYFKDVMKRWKLIKEQPKIEDNEEDDLDYSSRKRRQLYDYDNVTFYDEDEDENARESVSSNEVSLTEEEDEEEEDLLKEPIPPLEALLIHDAVFLFSEALHRLDLLTIKQVDCETHSGWDSGYSIVNFMKMSQINGISGLVKFDHQGFRTDISLDVIELTEKGISKRGTWNSTEGLNISLPSARESQLDAGDDLRNTTFIVLIALTHPYGMLREASKKLVGNDRFEGFGIDLIHELSLMSGFNYTFHVQEGGSSGNPDKVTGKWDGMIGEVLAGRADLAIADITITRERERDADFTMPFMNLGISILHRKPTKAPPSLFSFLSPFSYEVWGYMIAAYLGVSLLLFVMGRISPYEWTNPYPCIEEPEALENQFTLLNSLWFTIGSLMQQGSEIAPISVSTRMVAAIWWFFTLIMVSSYTANLAAFLTIENIVVPFHNVEELANQEKIKYGAKANGSTAGFFRDSKDPTYQKMWQFMVDNPDVMMGSNDAGVARVENEVNYAFLMESTSIEYEVERKCDLAQIGGLLDNKNYGIVMRQNSSYRTVLSKNVVKLQEKGKVTQLKNKWWKEKRGGGACSEKSEGGAASELDLSNVGGVFLVLSGGCIFAIFLSMGEVLCDIYSREDKISFKDELMNEIKFIIKCHGTTKPARKPRQSSYNDFSRIDRSSTVD
ncbi:glutamate receptor ionotropic, kainate 2-like isoform X2 [Rhodnius prolixus]|uniref:glutamate receptor ionotropic, kainate 2-like isoform X2 n=1 Tax=Rhodnius prolixus TaxID=13249 RepID=UPI003D18B75E